MNDGEYTDGYELAHPELIPKNPDEARSWMDAALTTGLAQCDTQTFLRAWWAFAWLNSAFHPDDYEQWGDLAYSQEFTKEAIQRVEIGEIDGDSELYAAEATHNAVWLERIGSPNAPTPQS